MKKILILLLLLVNLQITGYNNETKTFSVSDPIFKTQNSYKIEILTNPAYIEDEEIYAIKQKEK